MTFTSTVARHCSSGLLVIGPMCIEPPAHATVICSAPARSVAAATAAFTWSSSVTSATTHPAPSSAAASSRRACVRPQIVTVAPSAISAAALASPMPLPPPVTSAPYPSSAPIVSLPLSYVRGARGMPSPASATISRWTSFTPPPNVPTGAWR